MTYVLKAFNQMKFASDNFRTRVVGIRVILTKGRAPKNSDSCFISVLFVKEQKFENFSGIRGR